MAGITPYYQRQSQINNLEVHFYEDSRQKVNDPPEIQPEWASTVNPILSLDRCTLANKKSRCHLPPTVGSISTSLEAMERRIRVLVGEV